jgi:NADH-quinone oxidoreductase subunit M
MNLTILLAIPVLTLLAVLLLPGARQARWAALAGAALQLAASLVLLLRFREARADGGKGFLFQLQRDWYPDWNIGFHLGVDGISVAMILLTALVVVAGVLVSWEEARMPKTFFAMLTLLGLGAYGFFVSLDLFAMFFFLELAVVPKYLLIALWGSGRKEYSANKLAIMLMGASVAILMGIVALMFSAPDGKWTFDMLRIVEWDVPADTQVTIFGLIFIGFGVFTALFPFHTWVPDGHSSAPTAGSMFLAGISMKLGGYGCLRAAVWLLPEGALAYGDAIVVLSIIAILYGAFVTLMQTDLKYINAYSSVSHCGFVLLGIGMLTKAAVAGAVLQMVSHGLMTALFFAVIGMVYVRTHTRQVAEMGGLMKPMPFIAVLMFLAGLSSLGLPGLSGFVAEMSVFVGGWERDTAFHRTATVLAAMSIVVTAVYVLRAIGATMMGPIRDQAHASLTDAAWNEKAAALVLTAGVLAMGLAPGWLNDLVGPDAAAIVTRLGTATP